MLCLLSSRWIDFIKPSFSAEGIAADDSSASSLADRKKLSSWRASSRSLRSVSNSFFAVLSAASFSFSSLRSFRLASARSDLTCSSID